MNLPTNADQLRTATNEQRLELLKQIDSADDDDLLQYLVELIEDSAQAELVREEAAVALGRSKSPSSQTNLQKMLSSEDAVVRELAVHGLREDNADASIHWLIDALTDSVNKVRNVAERSLLKRADQMSAVGVEKLLQLLSHPVPLTRSPAARLLGQTKSDRALDPLLAMLEAEEWLARMWAAKGLGDLGKSDALPKLINVMNNDEKNRVRAAAVEAVAALRPTNTEELLKEVLERDDDEGVQKVANEALLALGFEGDEPEYDPFADD